MACRGFLECLLKLLNFLLTVVGLAMVGYGIYLFVEYKRIADDESLSPVSGDFVQLGRPMLMAVSLSESIFDKLPKAWVHCLMQWHIFKLSVMAHKQLPGDKTGDFEMIYGFLKEHWTIARWVALGVVVLEALVFLLALLVRAANRPLDYDSDDELIAPRQQIRQPLINRPPAPATGVPVAGSLDSRPSRNDAWSTRMREKYGLDTSEFTYNPSESHRFQQVSAQPSEERSRCTIM
ncbi:hypothetical protein Tsubulata_047208 [Turnera subulata]|uniref:Tobamovirus multiplication protein 2A n=1 Tax=Turnera subulata TaxID=218843 RepID=A0A9Q0F622_9ROSI|nr:hypothetical protein Tsubulata_047208 [Turnera subulata]